MKHRGMGICSPTRENAPCNGCTERFSACHGNCPKDARGEYGYNAWTAGIASIKEEKEKHKRISSGKHFSY